MSQKIAVVTGANGGLGQAMCMALLEQNRKVIGICAPQDKESSEAWQQELQSQGKDIAIYAVDVTNFEACEQFYKTVEAQYGAVDILVNNAGITRDAPIKRMQEAQWLAVINTNLNALFNMSQPIFDGMCQRGWGRIVNISSLNGEKGQFGQANYAAAKAGIYGLTKSQALEGAKKGVTANAISPGYIDSPMVRQVPENILANIVAGIPVGHLGTPHDIARAVVFLTADDAGFITGTNLSVNGGQFMA